MTFYPQGQADAFEPKAESGPLSKYCAHCHQLLDVHATVWVTAVGSKRQCPALSPVDPSSGYSAGNRHRSCGAEEEEELSPNPTTAKQQQQQYYIANPPFGTDYHNELEKTKHCKKTGLAPARAGSEGLDMLAYDYSSGMPSRKGVDPLEASKQQRKTRCRPHEAGSLRGTGVLAPEEAEKSKPVPARKSNNSSFHGAGLV